jgi:PhnB protein
LSQTNIPPVGLTWLTPFIWVNDIKEALTFYENAFGFETTFVLDENPITFARMKYKNINITLNLKGQFNYDGSNPKETGVVPAVTFYVYSEDVDRLVAISVKHGANVLQPVELQFWGDRKCRLQDPYGHIWEFATPVGNDTNPV